MLDDIANLRETQNAMLETQNAMLDHIAMRETQNAMLETQNRMHDIANLRETQNRILDEQASLRQTQNAMLETQNEILRRLGNLETRFGRLDHDYRNFRGNYAENAARKRAPSIAMYLDESKDLGIDELTIAILSGPDILALAGEYGSDRLASIPRETRRSFYEADLIIRADKTDGSTFYIAVEASYTCRRERYHQGDVPQSPYYPIHGQRGLARNRRGSSGQEHKASQSIAGEVLWFAAY